MSEPLFTIGHSNRTIADFTDLVLRHSIATIVDVRKLPGSTAHPQFDREALSASLERRGVGYERFQGLTGRRTVSKTVPFAVNAWWQNRSFHNYADHALSAEFAGALEDLRECCRARPTAVMCSEAVWWRCHRRIIADHLLARGESVIHILGPGSDAVAHLSPGAVVADDGTVTYPGAEA